MCRSTIEGLQNVTMWCPFDPHDLQYFSKNSDVKRLMKRAKNNLPPGVRIKKINSIEYFQTNKDYICGL